MADQNTQFYAILTNVGAAKQANADALGVPWKITQMGVGDANGTEPTPNATQTRLINEWRRAPLNQLKVDEKNNAIIVAEQVIPAEVGGKWIREIALYDAAGDMVAVANCPPTYKPLLNQGSGRTQVVRMNLLVSNSSNVELKIDPAVVLATREYVDSRVTEEINKLDSKQSVRVAATGNVALAGLQVIDGVQLVAGDRLLVPMQAAAKDNGLYVAAGGAWSRTTDADASVEVTPGLFVHVEQGTANGDSVWQLVTDAPITLGTTALAFEMIAGRTGVAVGAYTRVTVDKNGRVMGGSNPTTVGGYGLIDVYTKDQVDSALAQKVTMIQVRAEMAKFGVGTDNMPDVQNTDLKTMFVGGDYFIGAGSTGLPPGAPYGCLKVLANSGNPAVHIFRYKYQTWCRSSENGIWDDWEEQPRRPEINTALGLKVDKSAFTASLGESGWAKRPDGLIEQWGRGNGDANGQVYITFPIAFPSQFVNISPLHQGTDGVMHVLIDNSFSRTGCQVRVQNAAGAAQPAWNVWWRALGY